MTEHKYTDVDDTYLRSDMTGTNFGSHTVLVAGVYNTAESVTMIRFNTLIKQKASDLAEKAADAVKEGFEKVKEDAEKVFGDNKD